MVTEQEQVDRKKIKRGNTKGERKKKKGITWTKERKGKRECKERHGRGEGIGRWGNEREDTKGEKKNRRQDIEEGKEAR